MLAAKITSGRSIAVAYSLIQLIGLLLVLVVGYLASLYNIYDAIVAPKNTSKPCIVVSGYSASPFTSTIRKSDVEKLVGEAKTRVARIVYEAMSLALLDNRIVPVRGVSSEGLVDIAKKCRLKGSSPTGRGECYYCAWLGEKIAERHGIGIGDWITLYSLHSSTPVRLRVEAIIESCSPYELEVVVPLLVGQALRGVDSNTVSLAVIFFKEKIPATIRKHIRALSPSLAERILIALKYAGSRLKALEEYRGVSEAYWARLGLSRGIYTATAISLSIVLSMASYLVGQLLVDMNKKRILVARMMGLSMSKAKSALASLAALLVLLATIVSAAVSPIISRLVGLSIAGYPLESSPGFLETLYALLSLFSSTLIGIWRSKGVEP